MPSTSHSFLPPAPSSHLPGRLTSVDEVMASLASLENVSNLVSRLKVQAFVIAIHQLFLTLPDLKSLRFVYEPNDGVFFDGFKGPEEYTQELERMSGLMYQLNLTQEIGSMFDTEQPFERTILQEQLRSAYQGALSKPDQQRRGGQWEPFWMSLPNIVQYDEEEEDPEQGESDSDNFHESGYQ